MDLPRETLIRYVWGARECKRALALLLCAHSALALRPALPPTTRLHPRAHTPPNAPLAEFGLIGSLFLTTPVHGLIGKAMEKIGYPSAFYPATGAWMLAVAGLAVANGGASALYAAGLLAVLMGGAAWHHAAGEGQPAHAVGSLLFLGLAAYLPVLRGELPLEQAAAGAVALAAVGYGIGACLPRTPAGSKKAAAAASKKK